MTRRSAAEHNRAMLATGARPPRSEQDPRHRTGARGGEDPGLLHVAFACSGVPVTRSCAGATGSTTRRSRTRPRKAFRSTPAGTGAARKGRRTRSGTRVLRIPLADKAVLRAGAQNGGQDKQVTLAQLAARAYWCRGRGGHKGEVGRQCGQLLRVRQERDNAVADRALGRVMPGDEQLEDRGQQLRAGQRGPGQALRDHLAAAGHRRVPVRERHPVHGPCRAHLGEQW